MTLTEYKNQLDPVYMPTVHLQEGEYSLGYTITGYFGNVSKEKHTQIWVEGYDHEYCLVHGVLYTTDSHGNPKKMSCFRLKLN